MNSCSVIIATLDRPSSLKGVLRDLSRQTLLPSQVILSAAGESRHALPLLVREFPNLALTVIESDDKSAAKQRNAAAELATGDIIAFIDDDIEFSPDLFERVMALFDRASGSEIGAVSPRVRNVVHKRPGLLVRSYYWLQSGYLHHDYGAKVFGPCINCYPVYDDHASCSPILAEWLPATCLFVRSSLFKRHRFPEFTGYSYGEDIHLTVRIGREAPLFFLPEPSIYHHSLQNEFKIDKSTLTFNNLKNMYAIAREVLGLSRWQLFWKWHLHRLFLTGVFMLKRHNGWQADVKGLWMS